MLLPETLHGVMFGMMFDTSLCTVYASVMAYILITSFLPPHLWSDIHTRIGVLINATRSRFPPKFPVLDRTKQCYTVKAASDSCQ